MADIAEPLARINAVLTRAEKDIADVFYEAIQQLKNDLDLNELARLLENADFDAAYRLVQNAAERTAQAVNVAFINSGISTGLFLERAGLIRVGFDQVNQRAVNAMANNSLRMIADFSEKQRDAARVAMTRGIREGAGPIEQARNFREVVGLTGLHADWVSSFRAGLGQVGDPGVSEAQQAAVLQRELRDARSDSVILRHIKSGRRIPPAQIDKMVERYPERTVAYRANVIARTEALRSTHQGRQEMYRQAIARGDLDLAQLVRTWNTHMDGRERLSHAYLNQQQRGWDVPFDSLSGPIMFPGDPDAPVRETAQCRCIETVRIKPRPRGSNTPLN